MSTEKTLTPTSALVLAMPSLHTKMVCPAQHHSHMSLSLASMIIHLNDYCDWTREQIADWLETLELDLSFKAEA